LNHSQIASFIWGIADLVRDHFERDRIDAV
jgi:hypothetical protein